MDEVSTSPVPKKKTSIQMSFGEAMREVILGKKITRLEWPADEYGSLHDGWLCVYRQGINHRWLVSSGDMEAIDWVVKEESN